MWIKRDCSIDHVTLTFDLKHVGIVARGLGNLLTNCGVSRTFRSRIIGQHLSDASRDLAIFTFDPGGHGACRWYGSSCSVYVPSLNFVGLPVRKILGIYCVSINPPLDLWTRKQYHSYSISQGHSLHQVWTLWDHSFSSYTADKQTDRQTDSKILPKPTDRVGVGN